MPSVLEIEETLTEIQEFPTYDKVPQAQQRPGFVSKIIAIFKGQGMHRNVYSVEPIKWQGNSEMPVDTLARKYPYMYVDALLG